MADGVKAVVFDLTVAESAGRLGAIAKSVSSHLQTQGITAAMVTVGYSRHCSRPSVNRVGHAHPIQMVKLQLNYNVKFLFGLKKVHI